MRTQEFTIWAALAVLVLAGLVAAPAAADQVFADDVIVDGSACIGFDCVNGESFGFDTLRLKENNLRIHFQDTSSSASFPTNDWRILINDTTNGGGSFFGIEDSNTSRRVFTVEAGAPANALYMDNGGNLGISTSNPVTDIHVVSGNTPTLRLEQDGSSGFSAQTWDVAGNEANFFIRDVTNGSTLPIRIRPGAPTSAIDIASGGNVGVGISAPTEALHVRRTNNTAQIEVEETMSNAGRVMFEIDNMGPPIFQFRNSDNGELWDLRQSASGNFAIQNPGGLGTALLINEATGDVTATTFNGVSSRALKNVHEAIDPSEVLARLAELPISSWSYKKSAHVQHVGPMAEDFHATFGLGSSDKSIPLLDASGVALAAIQGLQLEVEARDERISDLEGRLAALEEALLELASN